MELTFPGWEAILRMLLPMCTTICIAGAILLFLRGEGSRSKRLLAYTMLIWGVVYAIRIPGILLGFMSFMKTDVLAPFVLIFGNLYAIVILLYPIEIIRPGWLNLRRGLLITSPYLFIVATYYAIMYLLGESSVRLQHWDDFLTHIGEFNVWYRLVIALSVTAYIAYLVQLIYRHELSYQQWCDTNYASTERMTVSWLRYYGLGVLLILFAFFWAALDGNTYCYVAHNIAVQLFFSFTFYKGFFHENPYSEGFFRHTMNEEKAQKAAESEKQFTILNISKEPLTEKNTHDMEMVFPIKFSEYQMKVQQWMEEAKPYLRKDFKLMDVTEILPLNRTYLSQIFNEGWGTSFSNVVRDYRIRYAEDLLRNHPELTINQISSFCGFTSPSAFHRTFAQCHNGITPKKYRECE